ncbi:MAG: hypothetical protein ACP5D6_02660 [Kosmotogaceae bacterium]
MLTILALLVFSFSGCFIIGPITPTYEVTIYNNVVYGSYEYDTEADVYVGGSYKGSIETGESLTLSLEQGNYYITVDKYYYYYGWNYYATVSKYANINSDKYYYLYQDFNSPEFSSGH